IQNGHGQTVLVSGEAGIGKSRLVEEAKARVGQGQIWLLQGNCFEQDRSLPFAPLLDLLRTFLLTHAPEDHGQYLAPSASELIKILPELVPWLPDVVPTPALDPEQEKRRLFHALANLFTSLVAHRPVLLILEDLHWSDDTTIGFLLFLTRRLRSHPILLLLTYRSDEVHPTLSHFLSALDREHLTVEFALATLTLDEVHAMLRAIFQMQRPVRREFLETLYRLTEGNPFFVEEVLKSLLAAGDIFFADGMWDRKPLKDLQIPRSVHDAVQQRARLLSKEARETLALAAVVGRHFDFSLLQALTQYPESELVQVIETLIAAQLIVEISAEQFAFRHALTRQAVYADLLVRKRRGYHLTIAQTLEQLYAQHLETHLAELAYHFYEAEAWTQALDYARLAGEKAQTLDAPQAALEHFTHAIDAAAHLSQVNPTPFYRARGQAHELLGNFEAARGDFEQARASARTLQDGQAEWQSVMDLGLLWAGRDYARAGAYFRLALAVAQSLADPKLHASSLNRLGNWLVNTGHIAQGVTAHHEALTVFQSQGDTRGMAETLDLLGMANGQHADIPNAVRSYREAIACWRTLGERRGLSSSLAACGMWASNCTSEPYFSVLATLEDCQRDVEEGLHLAQQTGWSAGQSYAELCLGLVLASFGKLGPALSHGHSALRIATEIEHQQWIIGAYWSLGETYVSLLDPDEALQQVEAGLALANVLGSAIWIGQLTTTLALACMLNGELTRAEAALQRVLPAEEVPRSMHERRVAWASCELALAQHKPKVALRMAEGLIASTPGENTGQPIPALLKVQGEALSALGQGEEAISALEEAKRGAQERGAQSLLWHIHRVLGHVYTLHKQKQLAERELAAARAVIEGLAASLDDAKQRSRFLDAALATLPKEKPLLPRQVAKQAFDGLSEREREVAILITHGRSSREIAETLVISQRTVETHVGNIFSKLGFSTRTQIAAWTVEKGLIHPPPH
ncbi:MAG TPA: AAA family ATPase, partial [Ktedonobacteraceae bacterium]